MMKGESFVIPRAVDAGRLRGDLESLARIGADSRGGITRSAFSESDRLARDWYAARVCDAGLELRTDGLGNTIVSDPRVRSDQAPIWSGSHLDTVPTGGAFDGAVGAIAALECLRRIRETETVLSRPVEAVVFSDEEGDFSSLLGSSAMRQPFAAEELATMTNRLGQHLSDALADWPWSTGQPWETRVDPAKVHRFVELHIEQGPFLERAQVDIGVVTSIVAIGGGEAEFLGRTDHAGTTPMEARADAMVAAATFVATMPSAVHAVAPDAVATCGRIDALPGASNVVAGNVRVALDFRHRSLATMEAIDAALRAAAETAASALGVSLRWHARSIIPSTPLDEEVRQTIETAATRRGLSSMSIASGAGHDSQNMARITPTGMIFIPSVGGRSHSPAELTHWDDVVNGANVLLETLLILAQ